MRHTLLLVAVLVGFGAAARPASAATIQIQLSGLNTVYNGQDLFDAGSQIGGFLNPAQADPLTSVSVLLDGTPLGSVGSLLADFAIVGVNSLPLAGGTVSSSFGGFFDLLTSSGVQVLGLDFNSFQVSATSGGVSVTGTGTSSAIVGQALPFGLTAGGPVQVSFLLTTITGLTSAGGLVTGFNGAGSGTLAATGSQVTPVPIPEPASMLLLGTGLAGLIARRYRRSRV